MASPPRDSPGARARRALLVDLLVAIVLAVLILSLVSGLGVVGFFGLPLLAFGLLWVAVERMPVALRRRAARRDAATERARSRAERTRASEDRAQRSLATRAQDELR